MTDDFIAEMVAKRKKRVRTVLRVVAAVGLVAFVAFGPGWMIGRAHESSIACSNADYEKGPDAKNDCTSGKAWLLFPKIVPWKRAAALSESDAIDVGAAGRRLSLASSFAPNADEQARAIADLGRLRARGALTSTMYAADLAMAGVSWRAGADRDALDTSYGQEHYAKDALVHGSIEDAFAFVRNPPKLATEDYSARDWYMRRGALLCLAGDEEQGRAVLHDAIRVNGQFHDFVFIEARVALAACGEVTRAGADDLDRDALTTFRLVDGLAGGALEDAIVGAGGSGTAVRLGNASILVAASIAERERPLDATLRIVAGTKTPITDALSPWPWSLPAESQHYYADPEKDEVAAARLEALALTAPEKAKPLDEDTNLALRMDYAVKDRYVASVRAPRAALQAAARGFWIEAAGERSRMGQCDKAEADARRALALGAGSELRVYLASSLLRCGRYEAADEIASEEPETPLLRALLLGTIRAQALAHAGKFDDALKLARELQQRGSSITRPTDDVAKMLSDVGPVTSGIDWLVLALALHQGDKGPLPTIETPTVFERGKMSWRDLVTTSEDRRGEMRWRMMDADLELWSASRPAELFVIGKATDTGSEVWVDKIVQAYTLAGGVPYMRARAEAARWRGDSKVEAEWLARVAAIEKLVTNPKKLALLKVLEL